MLVSLYMTVKNGERFLEKTLKSIKDQTYTDFEVVIVDDGSTDATSDILRRFSFSDRRFIILSGGSGRASSLNLALSRCRGFYVANIDCDDPLEQLYLEQKINQVYDLNLDCLFSAVKVIDENDLVLSSKKHYSKSIIDMTSSLYYRNDLCHSAMLIKKSALETVGFYSIERSMHLDYDLYFKLLENKFNTYYLDEPLSYKRVHREQYFESNKRLRYLYSCLCLQLKYSLRAGKYNSMPYHCLKFIYGLLPSFIRSRISAKLRS